MSPRSQSVRQASACEASRSAKPGASRSPPTRPQRRLGDGAVAAGVERDRLLDRQRLAAGDLAEEVLGGAALLVLRLAHGLDGLAIAVDAGAGGLGDTDARLVRLADQQHRFVAKLARLERREVLAVELAIALDAGIDDAPVQCRADFQRRPTSSRP